VARIRSLGDNPPKFLAECQLPWLCGRRICLSPSKVLFTLHFFLLCKLNLFADSLV